jgi:hypothetical protein
MTANITLEPGEWRALTSVFKESADSNGWSFRDDSRQYSVQALFLSVCDAQGTPISADHAIFSG